MSGFEDVGTQLGEGTTRSFDMVVLSADGDRTGYARARQDHMDIARFLGSGEYELARTLYEKNLKRSETRLVLPLGYRIGNDGKFEIIYPLVGDGRNLLGEVLNVNYFMGAAYFETDEVIQMVTDVATGLDIMHKYGFSHNDVKLSNILPESRRAFLCDFNVSVRGDYGMKRDRDRLMYIFQILLVGKEVEEMFESHGGAKCEKVNYLQGLRNFDDVHPKHAHNDFWLNSAMNKHYPSEVVDLILKRTLTRSMPLVTLVKDIEALIKTGEVH